MSEKNCDGLEVLVLDDEPIVIKSLKMALKKIGCTVEIYQVPEEALARINEKSFDIVVTDVVMGDIDGIQVLEHVMERSPQSKVIIMTAFAMMEMARKAMDRGAFDFIAKPFDADEIRAVVAKAAEARWAEMQDPGETPGRK
jgi:DNA-binding NtrC family response regulator